MICKSLFKRRGVCAVLLLAACLAFAGCSMGGSSESASSESTQPVSDLAATEHVDLTFGDATSTALSVTFTNDTGFDITGLKAIPSDGQGGEVALMKADDVFLAGECATVFLEPAGDSRYLLVFECGGVQRQLHQVDFTQPADASILLQGDVAYLALIINGNAVSTLQEEYDIAHPPAAEEPAAANYEESVATSYDEPSAVYYDDEPAVVEAPAQSEDSCVDDVILN